MISDVLSDAVFAIRKYQRDDPQCYESVRAEIDTLIVGMDALRRKLDTPPTDQPGNKD